ncbi:MAG: hypothetical protein KTR22_00810 [Flavobacteriaceae bacterium]|nr:hypothetical protein [Flavobacteriaceae bacterium]
MKFLSGAIHLLIAAFLTALTQVGGVLYIICLWLFRKKGWKKYAYFLGIYLLFTFVFIPLLAPSVGRVRIENSETIRPRNYFYMLTNRNYVTPELNEALKQVSKELQIHYPNLELAYLDANFPFIDGFPLLPHLSHNDGKKIDLCFFYQKNDSLTNKKPSWSGYGAYVAPNQNEWNQTIACKNKGHWQYDFTKYITFGTWNAELNLAQQPTKELLKNILKHPKTSKVFIEPHLKDRLGVQHAKLRFHGCQAVRHDDHIHLQVQ